MRAVASMVCGLSAAVMASAGGLSGAAAAPCPGNPDALGTARVLTLKPAEYKRIGTTQYPQTLPLADHEIVLTFDDGPVRPYTDSVLKSLAAECVKATYFIVGRQAEANPDLVRAIAAAGHSVGTHSQNHPLTFDQMPLDRAEREVDDGIASVTAALGNPRSVAPFFRIPGFLRNAQLEDRMASRAIAVWSTDFDADDWYRSITPRDIVRKAMARISAKGRGILLLHDVHPATAMALPLLLRELKVRGYRVVHVVPEPDKPVVAAPRLHDAPPRATRASIVRVEKTVRGRPGHRGRMVRQTRTPRHTGAIRRKPPHVATRSWDAFRR